MSTNKTRKICVFADKAGDKEWSAYQKIFSMKMAMNETSSYPLEAPDDLDKDEFFYSIKRRIYQSAKEGFSLNLQVLISRIESAEIRNVVVNQASQICVWKLSYVRMENFPNRLRLLLTFFSWSKLMKYFSQKC